MLRFVKYFHGLNVQSLRNGQRIAVVGEAILNPHDLSVAAFHVQATRSGDYILFIEDIRDIGHLGVIVDSEENLMENENLPRLDELLKLNFSLTGKKVETDKGRKVGIVKDFVIDDRSFEIEKIHIRPPVTKLMNSDLIVGRKQVVEVTDDKVVVRDTDILQSQKSRAFNPQAS